MTSTSPSTSSERPAAAARGSGIGAAFERCAARDRAALVPFVTAGHPSPAATADTLVMLADSGADVIELGVPFSDPLADGPVIQAASHTAIAHGVDLAWTLDALAAFRARRATPVVLFSYLNPLLRYGFDRFVSHAVEAGADGLLVTDLPAGADLRLERRIDDSALDRIRLVAPTTPRARAIEIATGARGFVYYIARTGVTGADTELSDTLAKEVGTLRSAGSAPVAVGFGIGAAAQAARVARIADGVVVGTALVRLLETQGLAAASRFVESLGSAMQR